MFDKQRDIISDHSSEIIEIVNDTRREMEFMSDYLTNIENNLEYTLDSTLRRCNQARRSNQAVSEDLEGRKDYFSKVKNELNKFKGNFDLLTRVLKGIRTLSRENRNLD